MTTYSGGEREERFGDLPAEDESVNGGFDYEPNNGDAQDDDGTSPASTGYDSDDDDDEETDPST